MENSSHNSTKKTPTVEKKSVKKLTKKKWAWLLILPIWAYGAFLAAQLLASLVLLLMREFGVPLDSVNEVLLVTIFTAAAYLLALIIAVGVPFAIYKRRTTLEDVGLNDFPSILDMLIAPVAWIVYMIASAAVMAIVLKLGAPIDTEQAQQLPFSQTMLATQWHYFMAFASLVFVAPAAEELLFRGYLYGKLRKVSPAWVAVAVSALAFGLAHLWAGPGNPLQWAVMIDTLVLGVFLAVAREYTGAIWVPIFMHTIKNGIAFYFLFMNPGFVDQLKSAVLLFL